MGCISLVCGWFLIVFLFLSHLSYGAAKFQIVFSLFIHVAMVQGLFMLLHANFQCSVLFRNLLPHSL